MPNSFFKFKQFTIHQDNCAMKVTTDACLFGAWVAHSVNSEKLRVNSLLDIGTGSGLLAIMIAQKTNAEIDCVEIDENAAKQAQENVDVTPWRDRISIMPGDARKMVEPFFKNFDVIISNPPFYEKEIRSSSNTKNIAHHSDYLTLDELLDLIRHHLTSDGSFYLLLPYKRNEEIKRLFKDHELHISTMVFVRQSVKHDYFRIMLKGKKGKKKNEETEFNEISIWDDNQQYTGEFVDLLNDYYLYL
jgi:tRNA1Val (adenine37-N6)-methyltransferase